MSILPGWFDWFSLWDRLGCCKYGGEAQNSSKFNAHRRCCGSIFFHCLGIFKLFSFTEILSHKCLIARVLSFLDTPWVFTWIPQGVQKQIVKFGILPGPFKKHIDDECPASPQFCSFQIAHKKANSWHLNAKSELIKLLFWVPCTGDDQSKSTFNCTGLWKVYWVLPKRSHRALKVPCAAAFVAFAACGDLRGRPSTKRRGAELFFFLKFWWLKISKIVIHSSTVCCLLTILIYLRTFFFSWLSSNVSFRECMLFSSF